jgi:hypothetical protein
MRIYEGSPRQDFEEVLRSIGAFVDQRGMRDILMLEAPDGFILQGLVLSGAASGSWSESVGTIDKETLTFLDDDVARFMDESVRRRGQPADPDHKPGFYEHSLRLIGHYIDDQHPRDVFLFEQGGAFVLRLHLGGQAGGHHTLVEFTPEDITALEARAPALRSPGPAPAKPS